MHEIQMPFLSVIIAQSRALLSVEGKLRWFCVNIPVMRLGHLTFLHPHLSKCYCLCNANCTPLETLTSAKTLTLYPSITMGTGVATPHARAAILYYHLVNVMITKNLQD